MPVYPSRVLKVKVHLFLFILALASCSTAKEQKLTGTDSFNFTLIDNDTAYSVSKGTAVTGKVQIPSFYRPDANSDYLPVTEIGFGAFYECEGLAAITIPSSITNIDRYAFDWCTGLKSITVDAENQYYLSEKGVLFDKEKTALITYPSGKKGKTYTIPQSVATIMESAFSMCNNLKNVIIPEGVTSIEESAFRECTGLVNITIPQGVASIERDTFRGCTSLVSVTIPSSVVSINQAAFAECKSLTGITIPENVTFIDITILWNCNSLASITVAEENQSFSSIDGVLFTKDKKVICIYPMGKQDKTYNIPQGVTVINWYTFSDCANLTSVTIPSGVTRIDKNAFFGCKGLTSIIIPEGVKYIEENVFRECINLTDITIPASVTSIGYGAFEGCPLPPAFRSEIEKRFGDGPFYGD